ncbi:sensor histidine kinase [Roseibacillus ishigakijimensis]|uniref:Histidine kinase domain-containing protein n=1 Tax=Roseibacillus ishigakijimensis TaxID=454146 RepID=A0A934RMW0_9BACT|nr:sensor histidine kinase [Roseibacillus ishigakijimensis]MBK1834727.1 hypothetical protein [Roseibacillus ishigakijimensis]
MQPFLLLVCFLLAGALGAAGQKQEFLVRIWQSEDGLPGNVVRSLTQTRDGALWVATAEGLAQFNGIEFAKLSPPGQSQGERLQFFRLFTLNDDSIWVSTFDGRLFQVEKESGQLRETTLPPTGGEEPSPVITRLFQHEGSTYCVRSRTLWQVAPEKGKITSPAPELAHASREDLARQQQRGRDEQLKSPHQLLDPEGGRWRLAGQELTYQAPGSRHAHPVAAELQGRLLINDMLFDREGNLWLASPVQGLVRLRPRRVSLFATDQGPYRKASYAAMETRDGTWWIGPRSGGIDEIRAGQLTHHELVSGGYPRPIVSMLEDSQGQLWFAARDGSLFHKPNGRILPVFTGEEGISKVKAIAEDEKGHLWFGGSNGLYHWDREVITSFAGEPLLAGQEISTLAFAPGGKLYLGTTSGRILSYHEKNWQLVREPGEGGRRWISSLLPLASDELWATTLGEGLLLWKNGHWHPLAPSSGLPETRLTGLAIAPGNEDALWLGSLGGILQVSRQALLAHLLAGASPPGWMRLDRSDGLPTRECVGGAHPAIIRDQQDRLWFPTVNGLAGIEPQRFPIQRTPPSLTVDQITVNGQPRPLRAKNITVGPGEMRLGFHFTGLNLSAPEKVTYRVQLEGHDDAPRFLGTQREVSYPAVAPGSYRFLVTARNGDGFATEEPTVVAVRVQPHFWQTPWFLLLTLASALGLAALLSAYFARRRMKGKLQQLRLQGALENERSRISRDLHDDLGASLTELSLLSALAEEDPDESTLRPALRNLSQKTRQVVTALDEIVWATTPTEDSLHSLVEYLSAFAREFLDAAQVTLRTDITRDIPDLPIGPRRRHGVYLSIREVLNNAVKHSESPVIHFRIAIDRERELMLVEIRDEGKGFTPCENRHRGNGLSNLPRRMQSCGGNCEISSEPGQGTTVLLTLPLYRKTPSPL